MQLLKKLKEVKMKEITKIAEKLNIKELKPYGKYMAKVNDKKH